jgi:hypothetical protein
MSAVAYGYIKKLERAGFTQPQVEALVALKEDSMSEITSHVEKEITQKIESSESRMEHAAKDVKLELLKEIQNVAKEVHDLRIEVSKENQDFRTDVAKEFQDVRREVSQEIRNMKAELSQETQELRTEFYDFKKEVKQEFFEVKGDISKVKEDVLVLKSDVKIIKNATLFIVGLVTIIATFPSLFDLSKHFHF